MNQQLFQIVRDARRRWRLRLALRGLAVLAVAMLALFLVATFGMDRFRFDPTAVTVFRILTWGGFAVLAWRFLVRPLARRVTDEQVALYLEEHEPQFDGELLSAVSFAGRVDGLTSRALVDRLVQNAVHRCEAFATWRDIERPGIRRASGVLAGTALTGLAVLLLSPGFVGYGAPLLLRPFTGAAEATPYAIAVAPGDTVLARGADLPVSATLRNFTADEVELAVRRGSADDWERWPMVLDEATGARTLLVFAVDSQAQYFVEAAGVRSRVYTVNVEDLPYVSAVAVEYRFPAYTGLRPRREEGGDIAALAGTRATVFVTPTLPVSGGALVVAGRDTVPLAADSAGLRGALTVREPGSYRVLLPAPDGRLVVASPDYHIDVLDDQPPLVRFVRPGRDLTVTTLDEVFLEAEAEDDFGVRGLELRYSVNGGAERTVPLHPGGVRRTVTAGHTLFLEEFGLRPGDFVSYHARAVDARPAGTPVLTDIYFLTIRPFDRTFREGEQGGGGGGGGGMGVGELSERQRDIIAGTFRVMRDSARYTPAEFRDHMTTLALSQGRLREEVQTLLRRIRSRGVVALDSMMGPVADALDTAVTAMQGAEEQLGQRAPGAALPPEQRALQQLQRAESIFRREQQVQRGGDPQGGGGGQGAINDELAELFELELDRMRSQYEQADRDVRQQTTQEIDETLEKLRELARRQQQEAERRRALAQRGTPSTGTPSGSQRQLAEETEELARRLERLSRERSRPELGEAARRIREAADAMRRAAADRQGGGDARAAEERLRDARRQLEQSRSESLGRAVDDALDRARRLQAQQRDVERDVERLGEGTAEQQRDRLGRVVDRKNLMAEDVARLEGDLDRLAREAEADQPRAARELREATRGLRQTRLEDKIRYSRGVVQSRSRDYARNFEESIGEDLGELERRLEAARGAVGESPEQQLDRTLERTRELSNALEGLRDRLERGQEGRQGQREQEGEQGEEMQREQQQGQQGEGAGRRLDGEAARQMARELGERRRELENIRDQLRRQGVNTGQLDGLLRAMGRFDNQGAIGTPRALDELSRVIIPGIKEFEYALRRALLSEDDAALAAGADQVAPEYRAMVEEYYRKLGRRR